MVNPLLRGNRDLIKALNRNLLLNIIRREGALSRTQLTDISGLSVGAVSEIINDLIGKNWLLEIGDGGYTGGRRQVLVRLNPAAGYAVGLKLMEKQVTCAVTDFEANVLYYQPYDIDTDGSPAKLSTILAGVIEQTLDAASVARDKLFGVGIGLAGVIDSSSGVVCYSPFFGWRDAPLTRLVQSQLNVPVYVENDVNTLTITQQLFGRGRHHDHFVVVTVGRGIGMGIVINGQLYRGVRGGAGEVGHIILALNGLAEGASLESLAADPAVMQYVADSGVKRPTQMADLVGAASAGDMRSREALTRSGAYLGIGLATVINILSPALVIVSGEGVQAGDHRLQPMFETLQRYAFDGLLDDVEVVVEPTDDQDWARGAASLVISKVFESPLTDAHVNTL
jgi:predicted NBD/HSP70 family sugar kinase